MLGGSFVGRLPHTCDLVNQPCPAHGQHGQRRRGIWRVFAMASRQANKQAPRQSRKRGELPETGYFAQADPSGNKRVHNVCMQLTHYIYSAAVALQLRCTFPGEGKKRQISPKEEDATHPILSGIQIGRTR